NLCGILAADAGADEAVIRWTRHHECHEYVTEDITTTLKRSIEPLDLELVQRRWDAAICEALGFPAPTDTVRLAVAHFDAVALGLEWRFALCRDVAELGPPPVVMSDVRFMDRRLFHQAV